MIRGFLLIFLALFFFISKSFASNPVSNQEIIGNIERHLFFNDEKPGLDSDSTYEKNTTIVEEVDEDYEPKFDIFVADRNFDSNIKSKEKLAYNTNLVGHYEVAIKLYKDILKSNPKNYNVQFALAFAYQNLHQYTQAKEIYYDLLRKSNHINKNMIVSNLLSIIIEETPQEAIYFLTKLSAQHPDSSDLIARSAITYDRIGKSEKAIDLMKKAIFMDSGNYQYKYNLAVMYDKTRRYEDAYDLYNKIITKLSRSESEKMGIPIDSIYQRAKYLEKSL